MAFAVCAKDRLRFQGPFAPPASFLVLMFMGFILLPMTVYMYASHPSWTWLYMVDPEDVPGFALLPLVVVHTGAVLAGYYLGARLVIVGKTNVAAYLAGGGALITLIGVILFWGRLGQYGTYVEYEQGRSLDIMDVKLGYVLVAMVIGTIASACFLALELLRDSRRVRTR